jgi:hypothetical protein
LAMVAHDIRARHTITRMRIKVYFMTAPNS